MRPCMEDTSARPKAGQRGEVALVMFNVIACLCMLFIGHSTMSV